MVLALKIPKCACVFPRALPRALNLHFEFGGTLCAADRRSLEKSVQTEKTLPCSEGRTLSGRSVVTKAERVIFGAASYLSVGIGSKDDRRESR